ncbi:contractile injection system tape measure protein [Corallincola platygyrae]|uniref:Contractile injection system tape measure protein n=1 Tax=Corallincola platygyrae TaxID=1193278 RepID=A0ABW4XNW6_9GAMM
MDSNHPHRIRRLTIHTQAPDQQTGLALRTMLHHSLPAMHDVVDEVLSDSLTNAAQISYPKQTWIHLPKLHLNITLPPDQLVDKSALIQAIQNQLSDVFSALTEHPALASQLSDIELSTDDWENSIVSSSSPTRQENALSGQGSSSERGPENSPEQIAGARQLTPAEITKDSLWHYLNHGSLPWYATGMSELRSEWQTQLTESSNLLRLMEQVTHFDALQRLLDLALTHQSGDLWIEAVTSLSSNMGSKAVSNAGSNVETGTAQPEQLNDLLQLVQKRELLSHEQGIALLAAASAQQQMQAIGHYHLPLSSAQLSQIEQQLGWSPAQQQWLSDRLQSYGLLGDELAQDKTTRDKATHDRSGSLKPSQTTASANRPGAEQSLQAEISPDTLRVYGAGLILLHPYLPRLFRQLNWLDDESALRSTALSKAAKALAYLAAGCYSSEQSVQREQGEQALPEHQLGWFKVLLGLKPDALLLLDDAPLPTEVIVELDTLLRSLLAHWTALKSSSVEGLRQSFLSREGLICFNSEHGQPDACYWQLTLERQGIDLLLDQLPFSITTVKLPWMQHPIQVSW